MRTIAKIMSVGAAAAVAAAMGVSASAAEFEGSANVAGYLFEMVEWQKKTTEPVLVDHYGTYTVSMSGLSVPADQIGSFYLKDYDFETNESLVDCDLPKDIIINTVSIKLNGNSYTPSEGYATTNESGKFEVTYFNTWGDSFIDPSGEGTIESFEITFEVAPADGSDYEEPSAADVPSDNATVPAASEKGNPDTGIESVGLAAAAGIISAAALVISRKKK